MTYQPFPIQDMITQAKQDGVDFKDLIEPFDGFHPSNLGQSYMTKIIYDKMVKDDPSIIGPINPNNQKIEELFKEQGGY
jgi:acyloxyacyl hydrolase